MKGLKKQSVKHGAQCSEMSLPHRIRRNLEKFEEGYRSQIEKLEPALGSKSVEALKRYVETLENSCETEIEAGRIADTTEFWSTIYLRALASVKAKVNSLSGNAALYLGRTGGGRPGERATFAMRRQELCRLVADIERKLIDTREDTKQRPVMKPATEELANE